MTFAQLVHNLHPEGAYAVLGRAQELEAQGRDILHLEIGQPDFQTFSHISDLILSRVSGGTSIGG